MQKYESYLHIDLMGGGGGSGVLGIDWGSEKSFIKRIKKVLEKFYESYGAFIEPVALDIII